MASNTITFRIPQTYTPHQRQGLVLMVARCLKRKTRQQLAAEISVGYEAVRRWERGEARIDPAVFNLLAEVLDQDIRIFWA